MIKMRGKANNNIFFPCLWLNLHKRLCFQAMQGIGE